MQTPLIPTQSAAGLLAGQLLLRVSLAAAACSVVCQRRMIASPLSTSYHRSLSKQPTDYQAV